jgi:dTDP-4-dehydrorhamnose 3,5-epimerase
MKVIRNETLPDVLLLEPRIFRDARGFFLESYNRRAIAAAIGFEGDLVQDNHSHSRRGVVRGLHYQIRQPQGKLIRCTAGEVWDVALDLRRGSATFGRWAAFSLSGDKQNMAWIPPGFAHGFLVVSESADVLYKTTDYYAPEHERTILWNDPALAISWPLQGAPLLSDKDARARPFAEAETFG